MFLRHAGFAAAALLLTGAARSADPKRPVRFDYEAEPGCPDRATWIVNTLGRAPAARTVTADEHAWTLQARITREGNRFSGRLQVVTPEAVSDTRRFRGNSCEQVALALSIAAALSVDPEHGGAASPPAPVEPPPRAEPPPGPPAAPPPTPPPPPERPATTRSSEEVAPPTRWSFGLGGALLVAHSAIDSTMLGGEIVAHLRPEPGPLSLRLSAGYAVSSIIDAPPGAARFYLPELAAMGCARGVDRRSVSLGVCGGARGGLLMASGQDVDRPSSASRGWLAWIAGLQAEVGPPHGLRGEIAASLAIRQTRYTYIFDRPPVTITDPPLLGWELSFGVILPR